MITSYSIKSSWQSFTVTKLDFFNHVSLIQGGLTARERIFVIKHPFDTVHVMLVS